MPSAEFRGGERRRYAASSGCTGECGGRVDAADLSTISGGPGAASAPFGYTTNFSGQGLAARVVYRTTSGESKNSALSEPDK